MAKIVSQRNLFFVVEISVIRRKISLQNCGTEMRHRNAAQNFSTKLQRKIVVQNCDAELCENEFLKDISIYIKVGDPRTKKFIVLGIIILSIQNCVDFFVLCLGILV